MKTIPATGLARVVSALLVGSALAAGPAAAQVAGTASGGTAAPSDHPLVPMPGGVIHVYRLPSSRAAPMPDPSIRDPDEVREEKAKHDKVTGADLGPFGDAYQDASPVQNFDTNTQDAAPALRGGPPP